MDWAVTNTLTLQLSFPSTWLQEKCVDWFCGERDPATVTELHSRSQQGRALPQDTEDTVIDCSAVCERKSLPREL